MKFRHRNLYVYPSLPTYKKQKRKEGDNEMEIYKREIKKRSRKERYEHTTKKIKRKYVRRLIIKAKKETEQYRKAGTN
jgi:hypothetical protein